jgi:hypothetical protein
MAQPARRNLRPARRSGLTSPDPVRTRHGPHSHPNPRPRTRNPGQAAAQGERQDTHARIHPRKLLAQKSERKRPTGIGRWIEAQVHGQNYD